MIYFNYENNILDFSTKNTAMQTQLQDKDKLLATADKTNAELNTKYADLQTQDAQHTKKFNEKDAQL